MMKQSSQRNTLNTIFSPFIKALRAIDTALIGLRKENGASYTSRKEKITVFVVSYVFAMTLWMVVNLNGSYNIELELPLEVGTVPEGMALVDAIPETIVAEISGEGWKLISLKNNPPAIPVDISLGEVDVFSQLRQRFAPEQDVSVLNVQPIRLLLNLEPMMRKKVPLVWEPTLDYAERYDRVGEGYLEPDSIWVSGAVSKLENLEAWIINYSIKLDNIRENITLQLPIISSDPALSFDQNLVSYHEMVAEYTEGEFTLLIKLENAPGNQRFNFSPSTVTVQYRVPIEQYSEAERAKPFEAYVDYENIRNNTTGIVTPEIRRVNENLATEIKSFRPSVVSFFNLIDQ